MNNNSISFDDNDISVLENSSNLEVSLNAGIYSEQIYTLNYIEGVFKSIVTTLKDSKVILNSAKNFLNDNVELPNNISLPEILDIDISFSLPSSENVKTYTDYYQNTTNVVNLSNANGSLNIRSGEGTDKDVVGKLRHGDEVVVLEKNGDSKWTKVRVNGLEGYVSSEYLRERL